MQRKALAVMRLELYPIEQSRGSLFEPRCFSNADNKLTQTLIFDRNRRGSNSAQPLKCSAIPSSTQGNRSKRSYLRSPSCPSFIPVAATKDAWSTFSSVNLAELSNIATWHHLSEYPMRLSFFVKNKGRNQAFNKPATIFLCNSGKLATLASRLRLTQNLRFR